MAATPRLALPFLAAGQAQKEFYHNEALQTLDMVAAAAVEDGPLDTPPGSPAVGSCYIIGTAPTDVWAGHSNALAAYTSGGWRFLNPPEGLTAFMKSSQLWSTFRSGAWETGVLRGSSVVIAGEQVVGSRASSIPSPTGGSVIDIEARSAINLILGAMQQHGLIAS